MIHIMQEIAKIFNTKGENMEPPYEDYCYECAGYGDDYYVNNDGELVCRCFECQYLDDEEDE